MEKPKNNTQLWYKDANILLKDVNELWPLSSMSVNQQVNALVRSFILITSLGYLITYNTLYLLTGILLIALVSFLGYAKENNLIKNSTNPFLNNFLGGNRPLQENFIPSMDSKVVEEEIKAKYETDKDNHTFTKPTPKNPMGNVLLTEINNDPMKPPPPPSYLKDVEKSINDNTQQMIMDLNPSMDKRLFEDLGDSLVLDRSMRQFYSMPVNDQGAFAQFLYGSMTSCKEGHETACHRSAFRYLPGY